MAAAGELAEIDVAAADVLGALAGEIHDRIRSAAGWPERFAVLDEALTAIAVRAADRRARVPGDEVSYAWRTLVRSGGTVPVSDLAAGTGWSERHLRARFKEETGLAPKAAARVIRFEVARRELQRRVATGEALRRPTWPRPAATSTRPTWTVSSACWPGARRPFGWPRSSKHPSRRGLSAARLTA